MFCDHVIILQLYDLPVLTSLWFCFILFQWGAMPLEDNLPTDHYHYQLSVYTAIRKNAGTASKPSFILSGDDADTGVRRLADGKRKVSGEFLDFTSETCRFLYDSAF